LPGAAGLSPFLQLENTKMALDKKSLDPTGSGSKGIRTLAHYTTSDNRATVIASGYFNDAWNELSRVGCILIFASDKTFFAKVAVSGKTVTLSAMDHHTDPT
jgi:hypothetical protein